MSNGTPELFEGGPEGPPSLLAVLALIYAVAWVVAALASLLLGLAFRGSRLWLLVASIVLLAASSLVLAREMGFLRRGPPGRRPG